MAQSRPSSSVKSHVPDPARPAAVDRACPRRAPCPRWPGAGSACGSTGRRRCCPSPCDRHVGGGRDHRLGERGVGAAVHQPERLLDALLDREAGAAALRRRPRAARSPSTSSSVPGAGYGPNRRVHHARAHYSSPAMATFDQLSAEQRAIVELVLQQGKTYDELADMLGMPEARVRELARDALVELAPVSVRGVEEDWRGQLADYVLGQQSGPEATATKGHLRRSEAARSWARSLLDSLEQLYANGSRAGDPRGRARAREAAAAAAAEPRRQPERGLTPRRRPAAASARPRHAAAPARGRGARRARRCCSPCWSGRSALLTGDDDDGAAAPSSDNQASAPGARDRPAGRGQSNAPARHRDRRRAGRQARSCSCRRRGLGRAARTQAYEVWLYNSPSDAKSLGAPGHRPAGQLPGASAPCPADYAKYKFIDVTREPVGKNRT